MRNRWTNRLIANVFEQNERLKSIQLEDKFLSSERNEHLGN